MEIAPDVDHPGAPRLVGGGERRPLPAHHRHLGPRRESPALKVETVRSRGIVAARSRLRHGRARQGAGPRRRAHRRGATPPDVPRPRQRGKCAGYITIGDARGERRRSHRRAALARPPRRHAERRRGQTTAEAVARDLGIGTVIAGASPDEEGGDGRASRRKARSWRWPVTHQRRARARPRPGRHRDGQRHGCRDRERGRHPGERAIFTPSPAPSTSAATIRATFARTCFLAFAYNIAAIPLAATGVLHPMIAAAA